MALEVAGGSHVILHCKIGGIRAQDLFDFGPRPDIELALLALRIGVKRGGKGPLRRGHFAGEPFHGLARALAEKLLAAALIGQRQQLQELCVVVKHLLEMRHQPALVHRVARKAAAEVIVNAALTHAIQRMLDRLEKARIAGACAGDARFFETVEHSLNRMCEGGIYDHLGGGFSRYSVDERWLVPHFEKMLYDNAQLLELLALAYQRSGKELFRQRARETVQWLAREMTTGEGAFAASLDADSDGEEGKFYVWSLAEIEQALGPDAADFTAQYDVTAVGNFEGHNILNQLKHLPRSIGEGSQIGAESQRSIDDAARFSMLRGKLLEFREIRVRPGLDAKVLADWNGLMISGLVNACLLY